MMQKIIHVGAIVVAMIFISGCGSEQEPETEEQSTIAEVEKKQSRAVESESVEADAEPQKPPQKQKPQPQPKPKTQHQTPNTHQVDYTFTPKPEPETTGSSRIVEDVNRTLYVETESFQVDPERDTLIECEKGTQVFLEANSLMFADGSAPTGPIVVEVREFYSMADFIGESLHSRSGDRLLETGGMIHLSLSSKGKELQPKENSEYAIYFPKQEDKPGMQTFYGVDNDEGLDWTTNPNPDRVTGGYRSTYGNVVQGGEISLIRENCFAGITGRTISIDGENVGWWLEDEESTFIDFLNDTLQTNEEVVGLLCDEDIEMQYDLKFDPSGRVSWISPREQNRNRRKENRKGEPITAFLKQVVETAPLVNTSEMGGWHSDMKYYLAVGKTGIPPSNYNKKFREKYASFKDKAIDQIPRADLNYYVQTASRFGWINCDRFYENDEPKIDYFVKMDQPDDAKVVLAFKDINSIMNAEIVEGGVKFSKIPANMNVRVIGISYKGDQPTIGVLETKTSARGGQLKEFKPFSLSELEGLLGAL